MSSFNRGVELQFAFRNVAARTGVVIGLWAGRMTLSSGKIHVVMTGTAGCSRWLGEPVDVLTSSAVVTCLTVIDLLRISSVREIIHALIVPDDDVRRSGLDTREIGAHVNLVNHYLEVDGMARVGIGCLRSVASIAKQHLATAASMRGETSRV